MKQAIINLFKSIPFIEQLYRKMQQNAAWLNKDTAFLIFALVLLAIVLIVVLCVVLSKIKKNKKAKAAKAVETKSEAVAEESAKEEAPAAEEVKEEAAEEAPAAEEVKEEETKEEAPVAEEQPVEEAKEEEAAEEVPAAEEAKEEEAEEESDDAAEEESDDAAEEEAPATEAKAANNDVDKEIVVNAATGKAELVRYNKSHEAKMILTTDENKSYFNEIKNYILSYGAKCRTSWACDSFNLGRNAIGKLAIKGKTLLLYVALEPSEYANTKYHVKDVSSQKKYEATPVLLRVKSPRSLKYAKELIDAIFAKLGVAQKEVENVNYLPENKTLEQLIAEGQVKETRTEMDAPVSVINEEAPAAEETAAEDNGAEVSAEDLAADGVTDEEPESEEEETEEEEAAEEAKAKEAHKKTIYHVSKREKDGREWKVFKQGSKKVIKLFATQKEALDYAKQLARNKDDGSYVLLHGLDGKIRKY